MQLGPGGSTAVIAIVIDGKNLWVANIEDYRAILCEMGSANQITTDRKSGFLKMSFFNNKH